MIDCKETLARFYEYLDSELSDLQAEEVAAHLKECRACFERLEFERQFGAFLRAEGTASVQTTALRDRIKARLQELGDEPMSEAEELFPNHADHAPIDDVPLPPLHPAGAGAESAPRRRRIPTWSYLLAAAALVLVALPFFQRGNEASGSLPRALAAMHVASNPQHLTDDPGLLATWLSQRVDFDPMVQDFVAAGCAVRGAAVDSIWAHLFAEADGMPVSVFVTPAAGLDLNSGLELVEVGSCRFWTAQEGDIAVVAWHWQPTGVVCAAAARTKVTRLVSLVHRVEEFMQGT